MHVLSMFYTGTEWNNISSQTMWFNSLVVADQNVPITFIQNGTTQELMNRFWYLPFADCLERNNMDCLFWHLHDPLFVIASKLLP